MRISYERGQVMPMNGGAGAFVLLAWLDEKTLDEMLETAKLTRFTATTLTTREEFRARLAETAAQGFGVFAWRARRGRHWHRRPDSQQ